MNTLIETLNQWGRTFLHLAWPMLWQSSLLIVVLFAFDLLFRRKIRAAIRYALWLVVLVKLCLPPALALPTGAAWWLYPAKPVTTPPIPKYVVTYNQSELTVPMESVPQAIPQFTPPPPKLDGIGRALVGFGTVSAALAIWLTIRWWQISRKVRRATASDKSTGLLAEIQVQANLRSPLRLKLVEGHMSPAVCGLFRPVILLPRVLVERLSASQLRAVLLHEAFHLRRRDVWVNCAQALLQIAYWWHPLLWLANARIRRLREEAVDDAVMLALSGEADGYAPTLLEVAKLALNRPLLSLGLVGIMESRSALRKRIERLVDFRPPRKAGLTFLSLCGIFAFSAVAVPMGQGPAPTSDSPAADTASAEPTLTVKVDPEVFIRNVLAQANWVIGAATNDHTAILLSILHGEGVNCNPPHGLAFNTTTGEITTQNTPEQLDVFKLVIDQLNRADGKPELPLRETPIPREKVLLATRFYRVRSDDLSGLVADLHAQAGRRRNAADWTIAPEQFHAVNERIGSLGLSPFASPRVQTYSGSGASFFTGIVPNGVSVDCRPVVIDGGADHPTVIELAYRTEVVGDPTGADQTLVGTNRYQSHGNTVVEDHGGMVVRILENPDDSAANLVMVLSVQVVTNPPSAGFHQRLRAVINRENRTVTEVRRDADLLPPDDDPSDTTNANTGASSAGGSMQAGKPLYVPKYSLIPTKTGRGAIINALEQERFDNVSYDEVPLAEVLRNLDEQSKLHDPDKAGIDFLINSDIPAGEADDTRVDHVIINLNMRDVKLVDLLDAIVFAADHPIKYEIADFGIVFSRKASTQGASQPVLHTRTFQVGPNLSQWFTPANLPKDGSPPVKGFLGIDWTSPPGKTVSFNDRLGLLSVRATELDLARIDHLIDIMNQLQQDEFRLEAARAQVFNKLNHEHLDRISYDESPLSEVLRNLNEQSKLLDPDKEGVIIVWEPNDPSVNGVPINDRVTGQPISLSSQAEQPPGSILISAQTNNITLAHALDAIVKGADQPIKYTVVFSGVIFSPKNTNQTELYNRTFRVDTNTFYSALKRFSAAPVAGVVNAPSEPPPPAPPGGQAGWDVSNAARNFFTSLGVNMLSPPGKSVFFNDRLGLLFVRATEQDLDTIERAIDALNNKPPGEQLNYFPLPHGTEPPPSPVAMPTNGIETWTNAAALVQDGKLLFEMGKLDEAAARLHAALKLDPDNVGASYYLNLIQQAKSRREAAALTPMANNAVPTLNAFAQTNLIHTGPGREAIFNQLNREVLDNVSYDHLPLSDVVRNLDEQAKLRDPDKKGINFLINPNPDRTVGFTLPPVPQAMVNPATGLPEAATTVAEETPVDQVMINLNLNHVRLADVLDAIVIVADHPIKYDVTDYGIVFSSRNPNQIQLYMRTFRVDPNTFYSGLQALKSVSAASVASIISRSMGGGGGNPQTAANPLAAAGAGGTGGTGGAGGQGAQPGSRYITHVTLASDVSVAARSFFTKLGVNMLDPPGKSVFFNDRLGLLFVRATEQDLDTIERAIDALNQVAPQVQIKARFIEEDQTDNNALGFDWYLGNFINGSVIANATNPASMLPTLSHTNHALPATTNQPDNGGNSTTPALRGILTESNFRTVLHALQSNSGAQNLGEPMAVTTSGRQTQMRATQIINVTNSIGNPQQVEIGPILDVIPNVLDDGYTINLKTTASLTKFLGYQHTTDRRAIPVGSVLPSFQVQATRAQINLYDGQTLVLEGLPSTNTVGGQEVKVRPNELNKELIVLVTVTLVDSAGNRIHSDDQMPFAKEAVPPQPPN